jgi:hypothetical protein
VTRLLGPLNVGGIGSPQARLGLATERRETHARPAAPFLVRGARVGCAMPSLPRPARLSLHDAIEYVAERSESDTVKAGQAVLSALGERALVAYAEVLVPDRTYLPGIYPAVAGPPRRVSVGVGSVPSEVWANYPWPWFARRAVFPRGDSMFRQHTADGRNIGPVFVRPTIATADIDRWLDDASEQSLRTRATSDVATKQAAGEGSEAPTRQTRRAYLPWLETFLDGLALDTVISDETIAGRFIAHIAALRTSGEPAPSRLPQRRNIEVQVSKLWPKVRERRARASRTST